MEGATFVVEEANSLASGYKSKFITTSKDKTITLKYNSNLFKNTHIHKDENGKEYVFASIRLIKSPYANGWGLVRIYK